MRRKTTATSFQERSRARQADSSRPLLAIAQATVAAVRIHKGHAPRAATWLACLDQKAATHADAAAKPRVDSTKLKRFPPRHHTLIDLGSQSPVQIEK
jgi:hypothetical protein